MGVSINLYAVVLLFAFVQGLLYIFLFIKRGIQASRQSDFWLAALMAALCVFNLSFMLGFMGIYVLGQALWFFPQSVGLVIGPIILYYLKSQINTDFRFEKADYRHFLPFLVYFCYHLSIFLLPKSAFDWCIKHLHLPLHIGDVESFLESLSACVYTVWSWQLYRQYRRWLPSERSDAAVLQLNWYRYFLYAIAIGVCSAVVFFLVGFWLPLSYQTVWIQRAIIAAIIYYISFEGYIQPQPRSMTFAPPSVEPIAAVEANETPTPDQAPKWTAEALHNWRERILQTMTSEKLYLHTELTLSELADKLQSNHSVISSVINTAFEKNFNDFVNEFRVHLFTEKVKDPKLKHLTLLALAFECGFNSKSTFNRAVKKVTGQMPSEFLKS
jgi:AraC-like DNA-binding protein